MAETNFKCCFIQVTVPKKKTKEENHPITASDWIVYLQGKISTLIGILLPLIAAYLVIMIAVIQINLQLGEDIMPTTTSEISIFLISMFFLVMFFVGIGVGPYARLQKRIIKGELTNHNEILKVYITEIENEEFLSSAWKELKRWIFLLKKKKPKK